MTLFLTIMSAAYSQRYRWNHVKCLYSFKKSVTVVCPPWYNMQYCQFLPYDFSCCWMYLTSMSLAYCDHHTTYKSWPVNIYLIGLPKEYRQVLCPPHHKWLHNSKNTKIWKCIDEKTFRWILMNFKILHCPHLGTAKISKCMPLKSWQLRVKY